MTATALPPSSVTTSIPETSGQPEASFLVDDSQRQWWRDAVVYHLYLRSYCDGDGDGIGDLPGLLSRLDHIVDLGVDAIWLNPCYPSPHRDGGYDITDHTTIDPLYGGLPAFLDVVDAAHRRGLKVLLDLVPNHCSADHPWFQEALAAKPGTLARARFHFRDGRGRDGSEPPNNWISTFGGSAWTRVPDGQWYLHSFDPAQPDFDWSNPEVADHFDDVLRTWFDRGVDGFRIDVAYAMAKTPGLPDADDPRDNPHTYDHPDVHGIHRRWRAVTASYDRDIPLIGEVWLPPAKLGDYIRPGQLDAAFAFDLLKQPWDAGSFKTSIEEMLRNWPTGGGVPAWALNNHDVHRSVTRYGIVDGTVPDTDDLNARATRIRGNVDLELGTRRALAAVQLLLALPGSVYLYQGEELGLPEVQDLPDAARRDPIWSRSEGREHGRDGSRVPMPWTRDQTAFGFSSSAQTWLPQPVCYGELSAYDQELTPTSTLHHYRSVLRTRRGLFDSDALRWLPTHREDVLAFQRGSGICVTVFGSVPYEPPTGWGRQLLSSRDESTPVTGPYSSWLRLT